MNESIKQVIAPVFAGEPDWNNVPKYSLDNHLWKNDYPTFWRTSVQLCASKNKGIYARLFSDESPVKAVFKNRDEPVYSDSCMELFFQPFSDDLRYVNIEINPNCAYLSAIGADRNNRTFVSKLTDLRYSVKSLPAQTGWGVELFIPEELISSAFSREFVLGGEIKANVYKCGDETAFPHYSSLFLVGTSMPDFHRPEYFGSIIFSSEKE